MTDDVFFKCTKCSVDLAPPDGDLEPGSMTSLFCGIDGCDGSAVVAMCVTCHQLCAPFENDCRCADCVDAQRPNVDFESSLGTSQKNDGETSFAAAADSHNLASEISEIKSFIQNLENRIEQQTSADDAKQDQARQKLKAIASSVTTLQDGIGKEIGEAAKASRQTNQEIRSLSSTVAQNQTDILDIKKSLKSAATIASSESTKSEENYKRIVKAYKSLCESVKKLESILQQINSNQEEQVRLQAEIKDDLTPTFAAFDKRLKVVSQNSGLTKVGLKESLEGPNNRQFANLSDMVAFWTQEAQLKIVSQLSEQLENRVGKKDKKQKASDETPVDARPERFYLDVDGMKSLLDIFAGDQSLRMIKDLPELFNAIDDQLSEKQTELADDPENESLAHTVESLSKVQNRLRSWQDHNDVHRFPNEENEAIDYRYHFPLNSVPTPDPELDRTVQEVKRIGYVYRDGENEIVLQKAEVVIWEFEDSVEESD